MVLYGFYIYWVGWFLCESYIFITRGQIMVINKTSFICTLSWCCPKYLQPDYKIKRILKNSKQHQGCITTLLSVLYHFFWGFVFSKLEKSPLSLVNPFLFSSQNSTNSFKALKHSLCGGSERRSKVKAGWVFYN